MSGESLFVDLDYCSCRKKGEKICGDSFVSRKFDSGRRIIAVLSDGLGSGVKANVLATMTASMAVKFAEDNSGDFLRSAEIMMKALPVCSIRKISYATFSIIDANCDGKVSVVEMGNPPLLFFRGAKCESLLSRELSSPDWENRTIRHTMTQAEDGDRIVVFSDGISQAGIGSAQYSLGWRVRNCRDYIADKLERDPEVSSRELARCVISEALRKERAFQAGDDMTCAVMHFRKARRIMLISGPPFSESRDGEWLDMVKAFNGSRIVCGGTTAKIISRELGLDLRMNLKDRSGDLPPASEMDGFSLVTEGIFTLTRVARYLEEEQSTADSRDPAAKLVEILRNHDVIEFLVGTRVNEAHQDPNLPVDIEIRRNIIKRIEQILSKKYLKETHIKYV